MGPGKGAVRGQGGLGRWGGRGRCIQQQRAGHLDQRGDQGVTLPSAPGWGRRQAAHLCGAGCRRASDAGRSFRLAPRSFRAPSPALTPGRCGPASLGRRSSWRPCPVPRPGLRQLTGTRCPRCARRSRLVLLGHRSSTGWHLLGIISEGGSAVPPQGVGRVWAPSAKRVPLLPFLPRRPDGEAGNQVEKPNCARQAPGFQTQEAPAGVPNSQSQAAPWISQSEFSSWKGPYVFPSTAPKLGTLVLENKEEAGAGGRAGEGASPAGTACRAGLRGSAPRPA